MVRHNNILLCGDFNTRTGASNSLVKHRKWLHNVYSKHLPLRADDDQDILTVTVVQNHKGITVYTAFRIFRAVYIASNIRLIQLDWSLSTVSIS